MRLNRIRVKEFMYRAGYETQGDLAKAVGVTKQTFSLWMTGNSGFQLERLGDLCRLLDCTPNDILVLEAPKAIAPASLTLEPA